MSLKNYQEQIKQAEVMEASADKLFEQLQDQAENLSEEKYQEVIAYIELQNARAESVRESAYVQFCQFVNKCAS
jgi:cytochrome c553